MNRRRIEWRPRGENEALLYLLAVLIVALTGALALEGLL